MILYVLKMVTKNWLCEGLLTPNIEKAGDRTVRNSPAGTFGEPTKKMSDEEYEKFIVEAKKGVFALKKIIAYANKVNEWTNENDCNLSNICSHWT